MVLARVVSTTQKACIHLSEKPATFNLGCLWYIIQGGLVCVRFHHVSCSKFVIGMSVMKSSDCTWYIRCSPQFLATADEA